MCRYFFNQQIDPKVCLTNRLFSQFRVGESREYHETIPGYRPTPLVSLSALAERVGLGTLLVKDESERFGLSAFKALGASFAVRRFFDRLPKPENRGELSEKRWHDPEFHQLIASMTLCTATDGNHGRAVAWTAKRWGAKAVIFMPEGSAEERVANIRALGADVRVVNGNYDDAVETAAEECRQHGWQMISDTSTVGDEDTAAAISAGYFTIFAEIEQQLKEDRLPEPDFVFIQTGVGALAAAAGYYYSFTRSDRMPCLISVEPSEAACVLESARSEGMSLRSASGNLTTVMAGLNCGTPSPVAYEVIKSTFRLYLAISDGWAERSMRQFYHPLPGDMRIESGESGAAGLAGLLALTESELMKPAVGRVGLGRDSRVLVINTEGITDHDSFERIINKLELD